MYNMMICRIKIFAWEWWALEWISPRVLTSGDVHYGTIQNLYFKSRISNLNQGCGAGSPVIRLRLLAISIIRLRTDSDLRLRTDSNLQLY